VISWCLRVFVAEIPRGNLGNFDVPPSSSTGCSQNQNVNFFLVISWCLRDLVAKKSSAQRFALGNGGKLGRDCLRIIQRPTGAVMVTSDRGGFASTQWTKNQQNFLGSNWGQTGAFQGHFRVILVQNRVKTVLFDPISILPILPPPLLN